MIDYDDLKEMVNQEAVTRFRMGGMNPNHPTVSGTAQNPDIHFQQRETVNKITKKCQKLFKNT